MKAFPGGQRLFLGRNKQHLGKIFDHPLIILFEMTRNWRTVLKLVGRAS